MLTMSDATFTFRVDEEQQEAALHDAWFRSQVQAGLDSANAGRLVPAAEVEAEFAARRAATRKMIGSGFARG
jgi:predicted transcriptional regulator